MVRLLPDHRGRDRPRKHGSDRPSTAQLRIENELIFVVHWGVPADVVHRVKLVAPPVDHESGPQQFTSRVLTLLRDYVERKINLSHDEGRSVVRLLGPTR
jgi:hypothetical protein